MAKAFFDKNHKQLYKVWGEDNIDLHNLDVNSYIEKDISDSDFQDIRKGLKKPVLSGDSVIMEELVYDIGIKDADRFKKEIQDRVELAHLVAQAKYNFKPVLMKEYYLYKHNENDYTLCLISPEEWGDGCPYGECTAQVRQLGDSTWEEVIPEETEDE